MSFQQWDPENEPIRPGLYTNIEKAADSQIKGGARGIVAIPLKKYSTLTAEVGSFYTITNEQEAIEKFGASNIQSINFALEGGAKEVLVYTLPDFDGTTVTEANVYFSAFEAFEARPFDLFVFDGEVSQSIQISTVSWIARTRIDKKHFMLVTGGTAEEDATPSKGDTRTKLLADDYVVNLTIGRTLGEIEYSSGESAPYIAGLIAGTPLNKAITYAKVRADDVNKRLRNSEIITALTAGSLVLVHDGEKVKVEQGLTTSGDKIRKVRARQAITTDIEKTARDNYIGKIDNNEAGQKTLISAIKLYLENLAANNILSNPNVKMDSTKVSTGDKAYLEIYYYEIDSLERVFVKINI